MDNLLFTALCLATLYYFCYYLPEQKKLNEPINISKAVQTEPVEDETYQIKQTLNMLTSNLNAFTSKDLTKMSASKDILSKWIEKETKREILWQAVATARNLLNRFMEVNTTLNQQNIQITNLQQEIRELVKRPLKPTHSRSIQTDSETELENTLANLIKKVQALNNSL